mmetsp:Transcript_51614/g.160127  ORF Transcript_51614/g.160127 Transcript_51614/m.160127 type:complete len:243 (-) Transcript_51614:116-844(-)
MSPASSRASWLNWPASLARGSALSPLPADPALRASAQPQRVATSARSRRSRLAGGSSLPAPPPPCPPLGRSSAKRFRARWKSRLSSSIACEASGPALTLAMLATAGTPGRCPTGATGASPESSDPPHSELWSERSSEHSTASLPSCSSHSARCWSIVATSLAKKPGGRRPWPPRGLAAATAATAAPASSASYCSSKDPVRGGPPGSSPASMAIAEAPGGAASSRWRAASPASEALDMASSAS